MAGSTVPACVLACTEASGLWRPKFTQGFEASNPSSKMLKFWGENLSLQKNVRRYTLFGGFLEDERIVKKCWWRCEYACEALHSLIFSEMPPPVSMVLCLKHPGTKGTVGRASLPTCKGVKPQEIDGIFTQKNKAHVWISPSWWDSTLCGGLNVVWIDVHVMFEPASIRWKDPIWLICFIWLETIHARCGHFATSFPSWGSEGTWIVPLTPWFLLS